MARSLSKIIESPKANSQQLLHNYNSIAKPSNIPAGRNDIIMSPKSSNLITNLVGKNSESISNEIMELFYNFQSSMMKDMRLLKLYKSTSLNRSDIEQIESFIREFKKTYSSSGNLQYTKEEI